MVSLEQHINHIVLLPCDHVVQPIRVHKLLVPNQDHVFITVLDHFDMSIHAVLVETSNLIKSETLQSLPNLDSEPMLWRSVVALTNPSVDLSCQLLDSERVELKVQLLFKVVKTDAACVHSSDVTEIEAVISKSVTPSDSTLEGKPLHVAKQEVQN